MKYSGPRISFISKNLQSANCHKVETLDKLDQEVKAGRMAGPFLEKPISTLRTSTLRTSPIGLVPKEKGWRLISHLSYPEGSGVKDLIGRDECSVQYASFDEVIQMVSSLGKSALIGVRDITSAFRLLPVHPSDFELLGIYFDEKFFVNKSMAMGCSISCNLFNKFSTFLQWLVVERSGVKSLVHYLDDFLFGGPEDTPVCQMMLDTFSDICEELGVPIASEKSVGPVTSLKFLGLVIDTVEMVVRIPQDKLLKLKSLLEPILLNKKITHKDLESVVGLMAFCSRAITSSRAFLRRFYDVIGSIKNKKPFYSIRINNDLREDAKIGLIFLEHFNGDCYLSENTWITNETLHLYTDSCGNSDLGCGAYFDGKWAQYKWPEAWSNMPIMRDITFLELVPIVLAMFIWASNFQNRKILFRIDNMALVSIINKRTAKSKRVMAFIRPLVLFTMQHNIQFKAQHIDGCKNEIADAISRFQLKRFRELAPGAESVPENNPEEFRDLILSLKQTD